MEKNSSKSIDKMSLRELSASLSESSLRFRDVSEHYKKNISDKEKDINAFISLTDNLVEETLKDIENNGKNSILSGVPISIKDNISLKGHLMTCASKILSNYKCMYDSTVVKKLKEKKALIVGKTNMDEFAMGSTTRTSYYGVTRNPNNLELVPGGSSGGSAASVAAAEAKLSIGTDTGGSVRQPAAFCGVYGFKPTYGSISRYGVVPMANTLDTVGIFSNNTEDALILFDELKGTDPNDSTSANESDRCLNIDEILYGRSFKDFKVAVPKFAAEENSDADVSDHFKKIISYLKDKGCSINIIDMPNIRYAIQTYHIVANSEISSNMSRYDGLLYGLRAPDYENLDDLYTKTRSQGLGDEVKRRIMLGTHIMSMEFADKYYKQALKLRTLISRDFINAYKNYDLILTPTCPVKAFRIDSEMSPVQIYMADLYTTPVNLYGNAAISVPFKMNDGNFFGLQIIADKFKEEDLFSFSNLIETEAINYGL